MMFEQPFTCIEEANAQRNLNLMEVWVNGTLETSCNRF
jgi:hypothetical protein